MGIAGIFTDALMGLRRQERRQYQLQLHHLRPLPCRVRVLGGAGINYP
jgi:hypothetical protein